MRLPGADFGRGMSGLGREGDGAVRVYQTRAQTTLDTAKAKNAVYDEFQKLGEAAAAWDQATQDAEADAALADFSSEMAEAETVISNTRAFKADEVPTSVQFERFEKAADGTEQPVDMVPSWKVAPQLYDHYQRQSSDRALSRVSGPAREKLRLRIQGMTTDATVRIRNQYFKDRKEDIRSTTEGAITKFANAEDVGGALSAIDTAVKNGVFSVNEGREAAQKIQSDVEVVRVDRYIGSTDDPAELARFASDIGAQGYNSAFPNMTPAQRVNAMQLAENKSLQIQTRNLAAYDRAKKDQAADMANRAQLNFINTGQGPTPQQLQQASAVMSPSEFRAYASIARSSNGSKNSDPQVLSTLDSAIVNIDTITVLVNGKPGDLTDKIATLRETLDTQLADGSISLPDYNSRKSLLDAQEKKYFDNPEYKSAVKYIEGGINPSKDLTGRSMNELGSIIEGQALMELKQAVAANPKINPMRWIEENMPKYRKAVGDAQVKKLNEQGLAGYAVFAADGTLNQAMTSENLMHGVKGGKVTMDAYEKGVNALFPILNESVTTETKRKRQ